MNANLFAALVAASLPQDKAIAIAEAVEQSIQQSYSGIVTKDFVVATVEAAKSEIIKWNVGTCIAVAGLVLTIVKWGAA